MQLHELIPSHLLSDSLASLPFNGLHFDSRLLQPGQIFVALRGEANDGHQFLRSAFNQGACAAIVDVLYVREDEIDETRLIRVADPFEFITDMARIYRQKLSLKAWVAITGTVGKTTTKEILAAIAQPYRRTFATYKNYNNKLGVVHSLLSIPEETEVAILELGTNHPGEIAELAELVQPQFAIITEVGAGHLEFFHDIDQVAVEKISLLDHLQAPSIAVLNGDNRWLFCASARNKAGKTIYYGAQSGSDSLISFTDLGNGVEINGFRYIMPRDYFPWPANLTAAIITACELGFAPEQIGRALENFKFPGRRMNIREHGGLTIIDDCYNANPNSMLFALDAISRQAPPLGRHIILVLGDMLELGSRSRELHEELAKPILAMKDRIKAIFLYGPMMKHLAVKLNSCLGRVEHFSNKELLTRELMLLVAVGDWALVKGSRGMALETIFKEMVQ